MAYTQAKFMKDLAIFSAGGILGPTRTRQLLAYAGRKGIQLAGLAGGRALGAIPAAGLIPAGVQSATPYAVGAGLGYAALQTPEGQALLAQAEEHGRQSRVLYERAQAELMATPERIDRYIRSQPTPVAVTAPMIRKKAMTKFNRAVKEGMKIVKSSTSYGKKGTIRDSKKAFSAVTKAVSKARKGGKAPKKGILRKVATKAKQIIGKERLSRFMAGKRPRGYRLRK